MLNCLTDQVKKFYCRCPVKTQWQGRWWLKWCQPKAASLSRLADQAYIRGIPELPIDRLFNRLCRFKVDSFSVTTIVKFRRESRFLDILEINSLISHKKCYITQKVFGLVIWHVTQHFDIYNMLYNTFSVILHGIQHCNNRVLWGVQRQVLFSMLCLAFTESHSQAAPVMLVMILWFSITCPYHSVPS